MRNILQKYSGKINLPEQEKREKIVSPFFYLNRTGKSYQTKSLLLPVFSKKGENYSRYISLSGNFTPGTATKATEAISPFQK